MILLIDNYDSFSYNLYQMIGCIEPDIRVIRNDECTCAEIEEMKPECIILSPGPGWPKDAGMIEEAVTYFAGKIPILGICLGHQAICESFGGTMIHAKQLMHGKQSIADISTDEIIFDELSDKMLVARYHSLAVESETLPECLKVISRTDDGEVMAVRHKDYDIYGLQFHPESVLTPEGKTILRNFIEKIVRTQTILDRIAEDTAKRIQEERKKRPIEVVKDQAYTLTDREDPFKGNRFKENLQSKGMSFICEVKKASPSKGVMVEDFRPVEIAAEYERIGASAISVLTEPKYFQGSDLYLAEITKQIKTPVLRKDFTVDEYMIYEAKILGASAVLLIVAILSQEKLKRYLEVAHSLGLYALVETHDEKELKRAVASGAQIIGVNNRDLKTFEVNIENSIRLSKDIPENVIFVSESGIHSVEDIRRLRESGADAVLVGEAFVTTSDKEGLIRGFKEI